jgi:hypothetical protein
VGKAVPLAVQNALKAVEMAQMGVYRDEKGRTVMKTDATDAAIKAIGFQPAKVAAESRRIGEAQQNVALAREVETEISDKWAQGIFEKDRAKVDEAIARAPRVEQGQPGEPIAIQQGQIMRRVKDMNATRVQRA